MTLENLLAIHRLQLFEATPAGIQRLLAAAERNLADARLPGLSAENRFDAAFKALYPAQEQLQREINPVIYTAAEFNRRVGAGEPFVSNLLANPILFIIGTQHDLGKLAGHPPAPAV